MKLHSDRVLVGTNRAHDLPWVGSVRRESEVENLMYGVRFESKPGPLLVNGARVGSVGGEGSRLSAPRVPIRPGLEKRLRSRARSGHGGTRAGASVLVLGLAGWMGACHSTPAEFDRTRALEWVERQVAGGPRIPGSVGHGRWKSEMVNVLEGLADDVRLHAFEANSIPMTNVIASFRPDLGERIFLMAHWDTRPHADEDPDPARRADPVPGANDGASGVAVLLEVARQLSAEAPRRGVDLFFVDGEDSGTQGEPDSWALGSQALAAALVGAGYRPRLGILLDMVGDRDLRIPQEGFSLAWAPVETRWLFEVAAGLGLSAFDPVPGKMVTDDHLPFLRRGIPCVDLIDLDYPYWHTVADTPDKVSAESLGQVGDLVMAVVRAETLP